MKKVVTLHPADLDAACERLAREIAPPSPRIVVGILTGGGEVGRRVAAHFPGAEYHEVALRRPTTERKRRARRLLRALPTWLADMLRRYESRRASAKPARRREVALPDSLAAALADCGSESVLIVDDAVDSGGTLLSVAEAIADAAPQADVRTAVLAVTTQHPAINPDYSLRRGDTLLRFPWSLDYK